MNSLTQYRGLPRQVYYVAFTRLIMEMGIMFVFPLMSLLLTEQLGFSTIETGYLMTTVAVISLLGSLFGGKLADQFGRRRSFFALSVISISSTVLAGIFCHERTMIPFITVAFMTVNALFPITSALITDYSDDSNRTECFSLSYIMSNMGTAIGPAIAGFLFYSHLPAVFYLMAALYVVAVLVLIAMGKESYVPGIVNRQNADDQEAGAQKSEPEESLMSVLRRIPILIALIFLMMGVFFCYGQLAYLLPLQLTDDLGLKVGSRMSALLWTVNGIACLTLTPVMTLLAKKRRALVNIMIGLFIYSIGFLTYAFPIRPAIFFGSIIFWSVGEILVNTNSGIFIAEKAPETHRGRCQSLIDLSWGCARCISLLVFSHLLEATSFHFCWVVISVTCLILALAAFAMDRADQRQTC